MDGEAWRATAPWGCRVRHDLATEQQQCTVVAFFLLVYLYLPERDGHCYMWAFPSCGEWGLLFVAVRGLLIAGASLVGEHGL